ATLNLGSDANAWNNQGTITASGSTVNLGGSATAMGAFSVTGSALNVVGTFTTAQVRTIYSTTQVSLKGGGLVDNTADTLALDGGTGSWVVAGGTLKGGTCTATGGAALVFTNAGGTLDGVTTAADLDLRSNASANVHVKNGLTLQGATVRLGNL